MVPAPDPRSNQILAALAATGRRYWGDDLEPVDLALGQVLFEPDSPLSHVVFPTTAVVALLQVVHNGQMAQVAVVGHEGVVGVAPGLGETATPGRAIVQSSGQAFRLDGRALRAALPLQPLLLLLHHTRALIVQMSQTALCLRRHSLEQQLCRWLLLSLDRLQGNEVLITPALIATMLAAPREDIASVTLTLQGAGLIRHAPGRLTVIDRVGLARRTCDCYAAVRHEYTRRPPATLRL